MPRFFLPEEASCISADSLPEVLTLTGEDAFHLSVSLRARPGDFVTLCTPTGLEISCTVSSLSGGKKSPTVALVPLSAVQSENEPPVRLTLFQGMPKGKKTDSILQKCTELGVSRVVFVYTDHAVPKWDGDDKKTDRFRKIAREAAMQCGRGRLVEVDLAPSLDEAIAEMKQSDVAFACYEREEGRSLKDCIKEKGRSAAFFVGPEGGISAREAALLSENGIPTVTLGHRILRTETAASAVLSMFLYENEL